MRLIEGSVFAVLAQNQSFRDTVCREDFCTILQISG